MVPLLRALQGGIEALYRIETEVDVCDFLVDEERRATFTVERLPKEQLFIKQSGPDLELGLFVDERSLQNLEAHDPRRRLDEANLQDFLLAVEGVSHFVYLAHRARVERPVSAAELELQAEVDKYLVVLLVRWDQTGDPPDDLRARLFEQIVFSADLSADERERYALANSAADDYVASLEARFIKRRAVLDLLGEVRQFYRKGLAEKLSLITRLAA